MKVFALAIGASDRASSRWRVWDHLEWLREQGHQVRADSVADLGVKKADAAFIWRLVRRFPRWIRDFFWSDAILVQEAIEIGPAVLLKNLGKRRRLVFDFSDPIDRAGRGAKRRLRQILFGLMARRADAIIVENQAYLDLLGDRRDKLYHFYGPVDAARFLKSAELARRTSAEARPFRIGWTGSHGTLKFIAPLFPIIDEIAREMPIELLFLGVDAVAFDFQHAQATVVPFDETADVRLVPSFDLGLFRLEDTEDALWRGAGKLFIYMAAGAPFIATDRGIASRLMRDAQVGFAVAEDSDWPAALRRAIAEADERRMMSNRAMAFARDQLSYEQYRGELHAHLTGEEVVR